MTSPLLQVGVPEAYQAAWDAGRLVIKGVTLRDLETNRIVAHLQPSSGLVRQASEAAMSGGPFGLTGSSLQMLSAVGSAASVLNLAVTAGGFALVLHRLSRLDDKVDVVLDKLSEIRTRLDRKYKINAITEARRSEEAFHASPDEQRRIWGQAEARFDEAITHFFHDVVGEALIHPEARGHEAPVPLFGTLSLQEALTLLDWLTFCGRARIEALYLLNEPARAAEFAATLSGWLGRFEIQPDAYVDACIGGHVVSLSLRDAIRAEGQAAHDLVAGWYGYAEHTRESALALHAHRVDTNQFVREVRSHPEPALLFLPLEDVDPDAPESSKSVGRSQAPS